MAQENTPNVPKQDVTQSVILAKINTALTAFRYQEILQSFRDWPITSENVSETQEKIKTVRTVMRKLSDIKEAGKRHLIDEGKMWDKAYNSFLQPLQKLLFDMEGELQNIVNKIAEENRLKEQERQRVQGIKDQINNFILTQSQAIAAATSADQLVTIEKLIGSHKANKFRYQEYLGELIHRCDELVPLIKKQKDTIRKIEELQEKLAEAEKNGNDATILDVQEKQEGLFESINETKVLVQEAAIAQATRPDEPIPVASLPTEIKYRRQSWKWEVLDIKELYKKMPELVELTPNKEAIDKFLASAKEDGSLKNTEQIIVNGLRIFLEKKA